LLEYCYRQLTSRESCLYAMSSSPPTTSASRSPSPHTPHFGEQVPFHDAWIDDQHMLQIDDLLEQHAFDDSVPNPLPVQHHTTLTKSVPHKQASPKVVNPPKDSCFEYLFPLFPFSPPLNLLLAYLSSSPVFLQEAQSPESRHKLESLLTSLAPIPTRSTTIVSAPGNGSSYLRALAPSDTLASRPISVRCPSFPFLILPFTPCPDANPRDTLNLITDIVCASAPTVPIVSCSSCRTREVRDCHSSTFLDSF